jgi:hypothetical protein
MEAYLRDMAIVQSETAWPVSFGTRSSSGFSRPG